MNLAEFTKYLFERPTDGLEWYFRDEHEDPSVAKELLVELVAGVFMQAASIGSQFSERQVCMGLRYLVNPSSGPIAYRYLDASIDFEVRKWAIASMRFVFSDLFAQKLEGNGAYREHGGLPLSYGETCYMWWDMFPRHGIPRRADMEDVDSVICQTIGSVLEVDVLACQESALHGLGHWFSSRPDEVETAVKSFLPRVPFALQQYAFEAMPFALQQYAFEAMQGLVQ